MRLSRDVARAVAVIPTAESKDIIPARVPHDKEQDVTMYQHRVVGGGAMPS